MSEIIKAPQKGKPLGIPEELLTEVYNAIPKSEHNVFGELLLEISRETKQFDENMPRIEKKRKKKEIRNKIENFFSEVESRASKPNEAIREQIKEVQEKFKEDSANVRAAFTSKKKKGKDCSKMLDCSNINTSIISTLTGNILVLLFILLNMYILGKSWWYTISRSDPRDYFA